MDAKTIINAIRLGGWEEDQALLQINSNCWEKVKSLTNNALPEDRVRGFFHDAIIEFRKFVKKSSHPPKVESLCVYIRRMTRNSWIEEMKNLKKTDSAIEHFLQQTTSLDDSDITNREEELKKLYEQLGAKLGHKCWDIIMKKFEGYTMEQITKVHDFKNINVAKSAKYKCWQRLFQILEKHPDLKRRLENLQ